MNIEHDIKNQEFYTTIDGKKAYVSYIADEHSLDIRHTIVAKELEGQGIASSLVKTAYDYAIEKGLRPVATCSYAAAWIKRHPEYNGCESKDYMGNGTCAL